MSGAFTSDIPSNEAAGVTSATDRASRLLPSPESQPQAATVAFRTSEFTRHLIRAVSAKSGELPSSWLRRVTHRALVRELQRDAARVDLTERP